MGSQGSSQQHRRSRSSSLVNPAPLFKSCSVFSTRIPIAQGKSSGPSLVPNLASSTFKNLVTIQGTPGLKHVPHCFCYLAQSARPMAQGLMPCAFGRIEYHPKSITRPWPRTDVHCLWFQAYVQGALQCKQLMQLTSHQGGFENPCILLVSSLAFRT